MELQEILPVMTGRDVSETCFFQRPTECCGVGKTQQHNVAAEAQVCAPDARPHEPSHARSWQTFIYTYFRVLAAGIVTVSSSAAQLPKLQGGTHFGNDKLITQQFGRLLTPVSTD